MISLIKKLIGKSYAPLNKIDISKDNLIFNWRFLSSINKKIKIAPVLKSNAYGHGLITVARILDSCDAPFLCVDSLHEAYELLKAKIETPILIMGYVNGENLRVKKLPFSYAVYDLVLAKAISRYQPGSAVHVFLDSGMHREGVPIEELSEFLDQLQELKNLRIDGLMSHFAATEEPQGDLTQTQIKNFRKALAIFKSLGIKVRWIHIAASGGMLDLDDRQVAQISNMARVGVALYGLDPTGKYPQLKPVLKLITHVAQIKKLRKGDRVGYGGTFTAKKDMTLGVLPMGYNDGIDRRLSNRGSVLADGVVCPIVGRVSMNITTVDVSGVSNPKVGQEVVVFSDNPADANSIEKCAEICGTIVYDLLVHLDPTIRREVV